MKIISSEFISKVNKELLEDNFVYKNVKVKQSLHSKMKMLQTVSPGLKNEHIVNAALQEFFDKYYEKVLEEANSIVERQEIG